MKTITKITAALILVLFLMLPGTIFGLSQMSIGWQTALAGPEGGVLSQETTGDKFVFGGTYTLESGETLDGNLFVFGGNAALDEGSLVDGDVVLLGGNVKINGTVDGEVVAMGGLVSLEPSAVVEGDVSIIAGYLDRSPGAQVYGDVSTGIDGPVSITIPGGVRAPIPGGVNFPTIRINANPFFDGLWVLFRSIMWAALAVLVVLFLPKNTKLVGEVASSQAPVSIGMGVLTLVVAPIILLIIAITIIGIPLTLLGIFLLFLIAVFGIISIGSEVGRRLGLALNREWAPAVTAGVGTFLLMLVVDGLSNVIPCIGGIIAFVVVAISVGAVLLTRFGTRDYPTYAAPPAAPDEGVSVELESVEADAALLPTSMDEAQGDLPEVIPPDDIPADSNEGDGSD
jgi:hypothetical protein